MILSREIYIELSLDLSGILTFLESSFQLSKLIHVSQQILFIITVVSEFEFFPRSCVLLELYFSSR